MIDPDVRTYQAVLRRAAADRIAGGRISAAPFAQFPWGRERVKEDGFSSFSARGLGVAVADR